MATFLFFAAALFCLVAVLAEDFPGLFPYIRKHLRNDNSHHYKNNTDNEIIMDDIYCPECGSPNVIVYQNGDCECEDCRFPFHLDYL